MRGNLILKRTMAELEAARARGRNGGRPPKLDAKKLPLASKHMCDRETPISEVCGAAGVSRATLYRYLKPAGIPRGRA